ncbi:unnamed protein product, partial [Ectocarpus sp. 13 AM-2016]
MAPCVQTHPCTYYGGETCVSYTCFCLRHAVGSVGVGYWLSGDEITLLPPRISMLSGAGCRKLLTALLRPNDPVPTSLRHSCCIFVGNLSFMCGSLRQSMKANKAAPTGEWKEESTVFADVEPIDVEGSSVRVYDCAGQVAYTGLLQMFLTPRS